MPKIIKRKKVIIIQSIYRGYITRKHLNDIICITIIYQNFINKLRKVLSNFVRRIYFPKRYYKKKYALEKIFPLKLKLYFRKWQRFKIYSGQKEKMMKNIYKKREKNRYFLLILKSFFNFWKIKCQQMKLNEKGIKLLKDKENKYYAINKLFQIIEKLEKYKSFSLIKNDLKKYLTNIFKKKYAEKLLKFYQRRKLKGIIKKYFEKWKNYISKEKESILKAKILTNGIRHQLRLNEKENLRNKFNDLRAKTNLKNIQDLKRVKINILFPQGFKYITNSIRKYIFSQIFRKYLKRISIRKKLSKIIINLTKKFYLEKWKKTVDKIKYEENRKNKIKKEILILSHLYSNIILSKYFYRWKNVISIDKYEKNKISIYNKFLNTLLSYINKKSNLNKRNILDKIKNYINPKSKTIQKNLIKTINNNSKRNERFAIKNALNKWKNFLQFRKLNELRAKNLETVARLSKSFYDSKKLSINLYKWKEKNNLMKFINKSKIKDNIKILFNSLLVLRNRRMKLFFYSLKIAKNNLLKKIIIKNISNTYSKKILIKKFIQWKLILLKKQNEYQVENINKLNKLKIIVNNAIKRKEKFNYASIKKAINKWYLISKLINKENLNKLLLNTKKGVDKINNLYIKNSLKEPFNKIKLAEVNQKNVILKRLKKYFLKNDRINLRKAFIKFLTKVKKESAVSLKAKNIYNLKQKYSQMNKQLNLSKYFNKWKLLNKILHEEKIIDTKTITNSLNNLIKIRLQKYAFDKLKYIKRKFYLNELAKKLFKLYEKNEKLCLYNNMMKWKNIAKKIDLNISQRKKVYEMILKVLTKAFSYKKSFSILCDLLDN